MKSCIVCSNQLTGRQTKFCSRLCKNNFTNNKFQNYKAQQTRGHRRRKKLISIKGGICEICGYSNSIHALTFHHKDPSSKLIKVTTRECANNKFETLLNEIEKCQLLCFNCHMELHFDNT